MTHEECVSLIIDYIDEELCEEANRGFSGHINACGACRAELEDMEFLAGELAKLPEIDPPPGYHNEILEKLAKERAFPGRKIGRFGWASAAGIAALFVLASIMFFLNPASAPESYDIAANLENAVIEAPAGAGEAAVETDAYGSEFAEPDLAYNEAVPPAEAVSGKADLSALARGAGDESGVPEIEEITEPGVTAETAGEAAEEEAPVLAGDETEEEDIAQGLKIHPAYLTAAAVFGAALAVIGLLFYGKARRS